MYFFFLYLQVSFVSGGIMYRLKSKYLFDNILFCNEFSFIFYGLSLERFEIHMPIMFGMLTWDKSRTVCITNLVYNSIVRGPFSGFRCKLCYVYLNRVHKNFL